MNQTKQQVPPLNQDEWNLEDANEVPTVSFENHYALFSFYDDYQCLSRGEIFVMIKIDGEFQTLGPQKLTELHSEVLKITGDEYRERMMTVGEREKLC